MTAIKHVGERSVTVWLRYAKDKLAWEHNHIEDGHVDGGKPQGHPSWIKYEWRKCWMYLSQSQIIKAVK